MDFLFKVFHIYFSFNYCYPKAIVPPSLLLNPDLRMTKYPALGNDSCLS